MKSFIFLFVAVAFAFLSCQKNEDPNLKIIDKIFNGEINLKDSSSLNNEQYKALLKYSSKEYSQHTDKQIEVIRKIAQDKKFVKKDEMQNITPKLLTYTFTENSSEQFILVFTFNKEQNRLIGIGSFIKQGEIYISYW